MSQVADLVGVELGPTGWIAVTQARIDAFAAATEDPQWIHVDLVRALQSGREGTQGGSTKFEELSGTLTLANGRLRLLGNAGGWAREAK